MYTLLVRLMFISALIQLGLSFKDVSECGSRRCAGRIERASRELLRIDWRPISVWPEEAKKFR